MIPKEKKKKLIRVTTVPGSLRTLLKGQMKFMSQYYDILGVSSSGKAIKQIQENEGIPTHIIEMTRKITPFKDLKATYLLYKLFKKERPFIVHTHTPKAGTLGMLAARLARVPNRLHTNAGMPLLEANGLKRKVLDFVEKATYANATKVYANSFGLYDIIIQNKFTKPDKLNVIGKGSSNGINTTYFNPNQVSEEVKNSLREKLNINSNDFVYVFVGRIVSDKGINELISAFKKIGLAKPNSKLLLVGPIEKVLDPIKEETQKEIETNENILSLGWQDDVRPFFSISNALVFPSYREGFPNVVLQAGALGLPSIVSDINGCNEIIINKNNGIIVPVKNIDALYDAMSHMINNPNATELMAKNSRDIIENNYQQEYIWQELLKEYRSLE